MDNVTLTLLYFTGNTISYISYKNNVIVNLAVCLRRSSMLPWRCIKQLAILDHLQQYV